MRCVTSPCSCSPGPKLFSLKLPSTVKGQKKTQIFGNIARVQTPSEPFLVINKTEKTNLSSNESFLYFRMTTVKGWHAGTHLPCPLGEAGDLAGDPLDAGSQGEE